MGQNLQNDSDAFFSMLIRNFGLVTQLGSSFRLALIICLAMSCASAFSQNSVSFLCTAENADRFLVDITRGVRQVWHGPLNMELQDTSWLGACAFAQPLGEHLICNSEVFASDSRADIWKLAVNIETREFFRFRGGWNGDLAIHSNSLTGSCVIL